MGLLDTLTGLAGGNTQSSGGNLVNIALEMLQSNSHGGLGGLLEQFTKHGFGDQVGSWISTGRNLPISAEDIVRVLGQGNVQDLARRAGIDPGAASGQLASILPELVDKLSPNGQLPQGDLMGQAFSILRGKLG